MFDPVFAPLPFPGTCGYNHIVTEAVGGWRTTQRYLDAKIQAGGRATLVMQRLKDLRLIAANALQALHRFQSTGRSAMEQADNVPGLPALEIMFEELLVKAKSNEHAGYMGFGADQTAPLKVVPKGETLTSQALDDLTKGRDKVDYTVLAGLASALWLISYVVRR